MRGEFGPPSRPSFLPISKILLRYPPSSPPKERRRSGSDRKALSCPNVIRSRDAPRTILRPSVVPTLVSTIAPRVVLNSHIIRSPDRGRTFEKSGLSYSALPQFKRGPDIGEVGRAGRPLSARLRPCSYRFPPGAEWRRRCQPRGNVNVLYSSHARRNVHLLRGPVSLQRRLHISRPVSRATCSYFPALTVGFTNPHHWSHFRAPSSVSTDKEPFSGFNR